jgi:hypothetical protein
VPDLVASVWPAGGAVLAESGRVAPSVGGAMAGDSAEPPSPAAKAPPDSVNAKAVTEAV